MADETQTDDAVIDPETGMATISQEALRNLRAAASRKAAPPAEPAVDTAKLQRENALLRAGVDLEHPNAKYLLGDSDLDVSDMAAVKAAATQLGVISTPAQAASEPPPVDTRETAVRSALQTESTTPGNEPARPSSIVGVERGQEVLKRGGGWEDAVAAFTSTVRQGFTDGDRSVVITGGGGDGEPVGDRQARLGYSHVREAVR